MCDHKKLKSRWYKFPKFQGSLNTFWPYFSFWRILVLYCTSLRQDYPGKYFLQQTVECHRCERDINMKVLEKRDRMTKWKIPRHSSEPYVLSFPKEGLNNCVQNLIITTWSIRIATPLLERTWYGTLKITIKKSMSIK